MSEEEDDAVCRICRCSGSDEQPLFHPCRCRGSVRFVHEQCCLEWLRHNGQRQRCELCAARLHFDPVYAVDAPQHLSSVELAIGLCSRLVGALLVVAQTAIAAALWIVVLPNVVVFVFRHTIGGALPPDADRMSLHLISIGFVIVIACTVVFILLGAFFDMLIMFFNDAIVRWHEEEIVFAPENAPPAPDAIDDADDNDDHDDDDVDDENHLQLAALDPAPDAVVPAVAAPVVAPPVAPPAAAAAAAAVAAVAPPGAAAPLPVRRDLLAQFAGNDDERVIFRELDAALGLHGMTEAFSRFIVVAFLTIFVEAVVFGFPAEVGRFILSVLYATPTADSFPLAAVMIVGLIAVCLIVTAGCWLLLAFAAVARWRGVLVIGRTRAAVQAAEAMLSSLKVALVLVIELAVFPFALGYAAEMALLPVTDETWSERTARHAEWPLMSVATRWVVGIAYMYSFAASIARVRRILRPGLLWFIRNPDDARFDPVAEIVSRTIARHTRRLVASFIVYLLVLLSLTALPVAILRRAEQLPVQTQSTASGDLFLFSSTDLVMFNLLLPPLVRLYRFAPLASRALQAALFWIARALGLETYFFGFVDQEVPNDPERVMYLHGEDFEAEIARGAYFERQAPYLRANWFALRVCAVVALMWATVVALVVLVAWAPLATGRLLRQNALRALPVTSDIHAFVVGALVLGFVLVLIVNVWRACVAVWQHVNAPEGAPANGDADANAAAAAAAAAAPALRRAPQDAAQMRANMVRFWRSMFKMVLVSLLVGIVRPILVGSVFRLVFIDSSPGWSYSMTIIDDWMFGVVIEAIRHAQRMVRRGDNVWRLPGEPDVAVPPAQLVQRFEQYDMSVLLRETFDVVMYSLTLRAVRVVTSVALGVFGMSVSHRQGAGHIVLLLTPLFRGLEWMGNSMAHWWGSLHKSIRDERYRIGVKLRNNDNTDSNSDEANVNDDAEIDN